MSSKPCGNNLWHTGRVLALGMGGMLYRAMAAVLRSRNIVWDAPGLDQLDLRDGNSIERTLRVGYSLVINCAAYTDVDGAESDETTATAVNGTGVGLLAQWCRGQGALLVHYSTDYVFDGAASRPYRVDDPPRPLGAYGRSKALGERLIAESGCDYLMIRTSWLYAPWGKNFVRTIARLARDGRTPLKVVSDQRGRPTSAEHLAGTTVALLDRGARGTWHVTDGGECTWFDFAREIAGAINPAVEVLAQTTLELGRPAPRPAYSVLDISATESLLGPMPHWKDNLRDALARLEP